MLLKRLLRTQASSIPKKSTLLKRRVPSMLLHKDQYSSPPSPSSNIPPSSSSSSSPTTVKPNSKHVSSTYTMANMFDDIDDKNSELSIRPRQTPAKKDRHPPPPPSEKLPSASANLNAHIKNCKSVWALERFLLDTPEEKFDFVNCATAMLLLGKQHSKNRVVIEKMLAIADTTSFLPRELSNFCYGVATGGFTSKLPQTCVDQCKLSVERFDSQSLSMVLWSFARMNHKDGSFLHAVQTELLKRQSFANPKCTKKDVPTAQSLATTLWAFSVLEEKNPALLHLICEDCCFAMEDVTRVDQFVPQTLQMIAQSLAMLNYHHERLMLLIERQIMQSSQVFPEQSLATVLFSIAKLSPSHTRHMKLCDFVDKEITSRIHRFVAPAMGYFVFGFAKLQYQESRVWHKLFHDVSQRQDFHTFPLNALVHLAFALPVAKSALSDTAPELALGVANKLAREIVSKEVKTIALKDLLTLLHGFAEFGHYNESLLGKLCKGIFAKRLEFKRKLQVEDLIQLVQALAMFDFHPKSNLCDFAVMDYCTRNPSLLTRKQQEEMLWALACLNEPVLFAQVLERKPLTQEEDIVDPRRVADMTIFTLHHAILFLEPSVQLVQRLRDMKKEEKALLPDVFLEMQTYFPKVERNAPLAGGLIEVDLCDRERRICVEVDGPECFFQDGRPRGPSLFRHRLLRQMGYQVFSIPSHIFASLSPEERSQEMAKFAATPSNM